MGTAAGTFAFGFMSDRPGGGSAYGRLSADVNRVGFTRFGPVGGSLGSCGKLTDVARTVPRSGGDKSSAWLSESTL